jgi:hypothetical protein
MFKNKGVKTIKKPFVVEPKVINPLVMKWMSTWPSIRSKVFEEYMFKDRKPSKKKFVVD